MFQLLGKAVSRYWYLFLAAWLLLLAVSYHAAPSWDVIAQDKEFAFLPPDVPSRQSEEMFRKAFPEDHLGSNIVLVVYHQDQKADVPRDKKFIKEFLWTGLNDIAEEEGGLASKHAPSTEPLLFGAPSAPPPPPRPKSIINRIWTPNALGMGDLLVSSDGQVMLVVMELTTEFLSNQNWATITRVDKLVDQLRAQGKFPPGVNIAVTGSAVIGRDHTLAELASARNTSKLTVILVVALLLLIYRAPLLALIPLVVVYISIQLALNILAILAGAGYVTLFQGLQIYITILAYGAGVDYCLFLTARYREALDGGGVEPRDAVTEALGSVGAALTASAATVICGIGMMSFAEFGKFHEAGIAIALSLFLVLCATLTFSPALFRLAGRWAFWPQRRDRPATAGILGALQDRWVKLEEVLLRRPGVVWLGTVAAMMPFVLAALLLHNHLSYDLVGTLPADSPSVQGTEILREHMPAGMLGPVTLLLVDPQMDFRSKEGRAVIDQVTRRLNEQSQDLGLDDVRSLTAPLGRKGAAIIASELGKGKPTEDQRAAMDRTARDRYLTDMGGRSKIGTRFDLILVSSPFSHRSIDHLGRIEQVVQDALPPQMRDAARLYAVGTTASVRDLNAVMQRDRVRIQSLVLTSVFIVLVLLLRGFVVPIYLLLSVLFSYYATLGVAFAVFWALDPHGFTGIDWKVAIFLFTILVAVGEDYNIFLLSRIREETQRVGPLRGVTEALTRTGPIISSCGIIMAGTFASLLIGSLTEMKQLGFALAFGVLLDTFIVRPLLVPAFLLLLRSGDIIPTHWLRREPTVDRPERGLPLRGTGRNDSSVRKS